MPTIHQLYASRFSQDILEAVDPSAQRQQSLQGVLQESVPSVETIAAEPGARNVRGEFTGQYANVMATELQELLAASDVIGEVPYFVRGETREWAGYYAPRELREGDRRDPRLGNVHRFAGVLTPVGTRRSHVRAVKVAPDTVTNPFGSASTEELYLAADASRPRWVSLSSGSVESATAGTTVPGEYRDFNVFDVTEPTFATEETYYLVYDLPYDIEWRTDPVVYDDYGRAKEQLGPYSGATVGSSATVGTSTVGSQPVVSNAWSRVYQTQHEYTGERVIQNGRLRLEPRPGSGVLRAYRWDSSEGVYAIVQLGDSAWRLSDWDVTRIGLGRVVSLTTWEDTGGSSTYELVAELRRGFDDVHFYEPTNASGSTPAALVTRLDAIAQETDTTLAESATVLRRSEVPDE